VKGEAGGRLGRVRVVKEEPRLELRMVRAAKEELMLELGKSKGQAGKGEAGE
jgi:hypothetical protein